MSEERAETFEKCGIDGGSCECLDHTISEKLLLPYVQS